MRLLSCRCVAVYPQEPYAGKEEGRRGGGPEPRRYCHQPSPWQPRARPSVCACTRVGSSRPRPTAICKQQPLRTAGPTGSALVARTHRMCSVHLLGWPDDDERARAPRTLMRKLQRASLKLLWQLPRACPAPRARQGPPGGRHHSVILAARRSSVRALNACGVCGEQRA